MGLNSNFPISIFANCNCVLGEGIYLDAKYKYIYWVDIIKSIIYRKSISANEKHFEIYSVGNMPSAILSVENNIIKFVDKKGICTFNINENKYRVLLPTPYQSKNKNYRANDATVLKNGNILYGTMHLPPDIEQGKLYISNSVCISELTNSQMSIPNTFIELDKGVLVSDSLEQIIFFLSIEFNNVCNKKIWKNFTGTCHIPDGGCVDSSGNIYIAMWDGFCVCIFDINGNKLNKIELPVPRPTNCVLVDDRWLYISSAKEGLSEEELELYPLSGSILVVDLELYHEQ